MDARTPRRSRGRSRGLSHFFTSQLSGSSIQHRSRMTSMPTIELKRASAGWCRISWAMPALGAALILITSTIHLLAASSAWHMHVQQLVEEETTLRRSCQQARLTSTLGGLSLLMEGYASLPSGLSGLATQLDLLASQAVASSATFGRPVSFAAGASNGSAPALVWSSAGVGGPWAWPWPPRPGTRILASDLALESSAILAVSNRSADGAFVVSAAISAEVFRCPSIQDEETPPRLVRGASLLVSEDGFLVDAVSDEEAALTTADAIAAFVAALRSGSSGGGGSAAAPEVVVATDADGSMTRLNLSAVGRLPADGLIATAELPGEGLVLEVHARWVSVARPGGGSPLRWVWVWVINWEDAVPWGEGEVVGTHVLIAFLSALVASLIVYLAVTALRPPRHPASPLSALIAVGVGGEESAAGGGGYAVESAVGHRRPRASVFGGGRSASSPAARCGMSSIPSGPDLGPGAHADAHADAQHAGDDSAACRLGSDRLRAAVAVDSAERPFPPPPYRLAARQTRSASALPTAATALAPSALDVVGQVRSQRAVSFASHSARETAADQARRNPTPTRPNLNPTPSPTPEPNRCASPVPTLAPAPALTPTLALALALTPTLALAPALTPTLALALALTPTLTGRRTRRAG